MWRDDAFLLDILLYARKAHAIADGITWEDFAHDDIRQLAAQHAIQIIGEAAGKISPSFREQHPEVPWPRIISLRHRIVHDYPRIELPKIWTILTDHIPSLLVAVEPLVPKDSE